MKGSYVFVDSGFILPNFNPNEGEDAFLRMIFRGDNSIVAGGGNFYMGLCGNVSGETLTMTGITGEPVTGGYARQAITRDATGWPSIAVVNGHVRIQSDTVTWTAAGADIGPFSRLFLTTTASGVGGKLLSVSAPLLTEYTIPNGQSLSLAYIFNGD